MTSNAIFTDNRGITINVDLTNGFRDRLATWLEEKQPEIFWDIEFHEGGSIQVTPDCITFSGDNGIFELDAINIELV
tara:strand:- start:2311 stop:2541 length:231 start_codon:yes stop_codon:yes gene_type:complete